jgi:hypothetical protein
MKRLGKPFLRQKPPNVMMATPMNVFTITLQFAALNKAGDSLAAG